MLLPCSRVLFVANTQFLLKAVRAAGSHHLAWRRLPTISKARFAVIVSHKRLHIIEKYGIVGNLEPKANIYMHTQCVWSSANAIFWIPKLRGCASCIDSFNRGTALIGEKGSWGAAEHHYNVIHSENSLTMHRATSLWLEHVHDVSLVFSF